MNESLNIHNNQDTIIHLPCIGTPSLCRYGSQSNYQRFRYSYFIKNDTNSTNETIIYKYIICSVKYAPDELYYSVDGMAGKCWVVSINDNENGKLIKYYIRNWIDIVDFYKEKGIVFVEEK